MRKATSICCTPAFAQTRQISGVITSSEYNQAVQGVTVAVKNGRASIVTNAEGRYSLSVPNDDDFRILFGSFIHGLIP